MKNLLLIGASGFIGSGIRQAAQVSGLQVTGTSSTREVPGLVRFDLTTQRISDLLPAGVLLGMDLAVICAAVGSMEACSRDPEGTARVNVDCTMRLIGELDRLGMKIVLLSTGAVFDGRRGGYRESDPVSPVNQYGRQKAEVERRLLAGIPSALVLRLSKVIGDSPDQRHLLSEWQLNLAAGEQICCIEGDIFCPTLCSDVAAAILQAVSCGLDGLLHIANPEIISRVNLARQFSAIFGKDDSVTVKPVKNFGFLEQRPLDTSLVCQKFIKSTGFNFTSIQTIISNYRNTLRADAII